MFLYQINFYNEITQCQEDLTGLICASCLKDASAEISDYYGESNIMSLSLSYITNNNFIEIPEDVNVVSIIERNK